MTEIKRYNSNTIWEKEVAYSRAIRFGNFIEVSGTTAVNEAEEIIGKNDAYLQAKFIFEKIEKSLKNLGGSLENVVRTRMYIVDENDWQAVGKAHQEFMQKAMPVASMLVVKALINKDLLVEIELSAYVPE